jgi:hypothetical protein
MNWTRTGMLIAALALGWWVLQRAQHVQADGGTSPNPDPKMVVTMPNLDPKMVVTMANPDLKMAVTPPWPRDNTAR